MFFKKQRNSEKESNIFDIHKSEFVEPEIDIKSMYYENVATGMTMIELEKEMQSRLDLLL